MKRLVAVSPVVEALVITADVANTFCAKVLRKRSVDDPSDPPRSVDGVMLPATWRRSVGAATPTPTLPEASTWKKVAPDDEETVRGLRVVVPCTRNAAVAEVAFTPDTMPLSRSVPIPIADGDVQRVMNPLAPPVRVAVMLRVDVATQRVDVPVV